MATKIAVIGSRRFSRPDLVEDFIAGRSSDDTVISGGAPGVDTMAAEAAHRQNLRSIVFTADWDAHGRSAGPMRNLQIVAAADEVVAFWNGTSRGTLNTVIQALAAGKAATVIAEDGLVLKLSAVLKAAKERGVIASIRAAAPDSNPEEAIILASLAQAQTPKWRGAIGEIRAVYGAAQLLDGVHLLDTRPHADGWGRFLPRSGRGDFAEWIRCNAVAQVTGSSGTGEALVHVNAREAYSFTCRPSFAGPSLIRIADHNGRLLLNGFLGGRSTEPRVGSLFHEISPDDWVQLREQITKMGLWELGKAEAPQGLDGEVWTFEGLVNGQYHCVTHWNPQLSAIRELAQMFITLANGGNDASSPGNAQ